MFHSHLNHSPFFTENVNICIMVVQGFFSSENTVYAASFRMTLN